MHPMFLRMNKHSLFIHGGSFSLFIGAGLSSVHRVNPLDPWVIVELRSARAVLPESPRRSLSFIGRAGSSAAVLREWTGGVLR